MGTSYLKRSLAAFVFCFGFFISFASATTDDELSRLKEEFKVMQNRIEKLESEKLTAKEAVKNEEVKKFSAEGLKWHGYFSWNFEDETRANMNPSFDAFALSLIPTIALNEKVDIYSQIIYEHGPFYDISVSSATGGRTLDSRSSGEMTINDSYLTYTFDDKLKLRAGKFATPFGLWNTLMYASPTYPTIKQPGRDTLYNRGSTTDTDANFFARYAMGAWFLGNYDIFSYDVFVTNGRTGFAQHKDDNRDKGFGVRLGAEFNPGENKLKFLYSYYQDKLRSSVAQSFFHQQTNAFSSEFTAGDFKLTGEYALSKKQGLYMDALYLLAEYHLKSDKYIPFVQYQLNEPNRKIGKDRTNYISYGLAYQIIPWRAMLKFQIDRVDIETKSSQDYNRYLLGLAAAF